MKAFNGLEKTRVMPILRSALKEDIGRGDITTGITISKLASIRAGIVLRKDGVVCGLPIAEMIMSILDYSVRIKPTVNEGDYASEAKEILYLEGRARPILAAERTLLNFLGRLSGIATRTDEFVKKVKKYNVKIMDTRKTTPLLRYLEKYAVRVGGGHNHRMGLWDQVLIKDNHIKIARLLSSEIPSKMTPVGEIIDIARRKKQRNIKLEIEVENLQEFEEVLRLKPDIIMLDNMSVDDVGKAVELRGARKGVLLEVSGGITLDNIEEYAACGIDMISIGSLTAGIQSLDMSLEVIG
jgi:nicotinate-nucleotide pyrophosphorylase (carboxylating)